MIPEEVAENHKPGRKVKQGVIKTMEKLWFIVRHAESWVIATFIDSSPGTADLDQT